MVARMKEQGHDVLYYENIEGGHGGAPKQRGQTISVRPLCKMKIASCADLLPLVLSAQFLFSGAAKAADYAIGADLSFLKQAEAQGAVFKDHGQAKPGLAIFRDHGYNWIRLRLFHTPSRLPNNLEYTVALAKDAREQGFRFLRLPLLRYLGRPSQADHPQSMGGQIACGTGGGCLRIHPGDDGRVSGCGCVAGHGASGQ